MLSPTPAPNSAIVTPACFARSKCRPHVVVFPVTVTLLTPPSVAPKNASRAGTVVANASPKKYAGAESS